jgi:hypothetical protein
MEASPNELDMIFSSNLLHLYTVLEHLDWGGIELDVTDKEAKSHGRLAGWLFGDDFVWRCKCYGSGKYGAIVSTRIGTHE